MAHQIYLELDFSAAEKSATIIHTNIKESYIDDFLAEIVHAQVGKGADNRKANEQDIYNIMISCDLTYDLINISSNTGNAGLTTGIIGHSIENWKFSESLLEEMAKPRAGPPSKVLEQLENMRIEKED
jgi:hypothetical protein